MTILKLNKSFYLNLDPYPFLILVSSRECSCHLRPWKTTETLTRNSNVRFVILCFNGKPTWIFTRRRSTIWPLHYVVSVTKRKGKITFLLFFYPKPKMGSVPYGVRDQCISMKQWNRQFFSFQCYWRFLSLIFLTVFLLILMVMHIKIPNWLRDY